MERLERRAYYKLLVHVSMTTQRAVADADALRRRAETTICYVHDIVITNLTPSWKHSTSTRRQRFVITHLLIYFCHLTDDTDARAVAVDLFLD